MAESVAEAIDGLDKLVVEAGTGTGKTFAYLLPALMSGRKTIISTGTKALQDQLYHRDLPLVSKAVGRPVTTALLKGRANYLCLHRIETALPPDGLHADLDAARQWRHRTSTGDRAELTEVAEDSSIWPLVTSTAENCLGKQCEFYQDCHVVKARRAAQEADLVVVNHHLLLADLAMKEEGFIEFLPGAEAIILDEAHQIPDLAAQFFGISLGSRELERLVDELRAATLPFANRQLDKCIDKVQTATQILRAESPRTEGRHELSAVIAEIRTPLADLQIALQNLLVPLGELVDASIEIDKLNEQLISVASRLSQLVSDDSWDGLRWLDVNPRSVRLNLTPLDVADTLRGLMNGGHQAWIFTSATLAIGDDFSHFADRMGLAATPGLSFPSPYALDKHGLIYLPPGLPAPSDAEHTEKMLAAVMPLLDMTSGGMFCLFTSHRALNAARKWAKRNKRRLGGRPLLIQGDAPRDDLLRRFRDHRNAVLFGTGSFWEGVDVRGQALTVVAIDKLPFASPADPLMMARLEFIRRRGGNGFSEHQLPQAALALKQGAGRLLRDQADYGVVVLCDPRITSKSYGKVFLKCLEPMQTTDSIDDVAVFLAQHEARSKTA
ncbi:MAG: ATP-dependent DNA helicase [Gammaproteobacteria bacterium]|nr:ATP-dependent DNA helicase [Gammaproteobacteria bacterium]MDH5212897.1 ATP-dependent DNA helicase [Gammaproteobacteria bacterium]MDH5501939.1 ATP-dependent DNA helicase [Gammaproteobacteria bacterium]